jgi:hypothetical protein
VEATRLEVRIDPLKIAPGEEEVTVLETAIDKYGLVKDESSTSKLLVSHGFHLPLLDSSEDSLDTMIGHGRFSGFQIFFEDVAFLNGYWRQGAVLGYDSHPHAVVRYP